MAENTLSPETIQAVGVEVVPTVKLKKDGTPQLKRGRKPGQKNAPKTPTVQKITAKLLAVVNKGGTLNMEFDNGFPVLYGGESGEPSTNVGFLSATRAKLASEFFDQLPVYNGNWRDFLAAFEGVASNEQVMVIVGFAVNWKLPAVVPSELPAVVPTEPVQ